MATALGVSGVSSVVEFFLSSQLWFTVFVCSWIAFFVAGRMSKGSRRVDLSRADSFFYYLLYFTLSMGVLNGVVLAIRVLSPF